MSDEVAVAPPNIWRFEECNTVNTDGINMKEYKPIGQFYHDSNMLCTMFGIKLHPIFREPAVAPPTDASGEGADAAGEPPKAKEPTTIIVNKYRLDANSMKVLFKVLEGCQHIQTLK
jgi:hypothetical protein